jgi:hypothetical protein
MTNDEIFLQNLLAMAAVLLDSSAKALLTSPRLADQCLASEIQEWFYETKSSLSHRASSAAQETTSTSAPSAVMRGENWKPASPSSPGITNLSSKPVDATTTETAPFSPDSDGGIIPESTPSEKLSKPSQLNYFFMK